MNYEELIEEAAEAIHTVAEGGAILWADARMSAKDHHRHEARAALAVFEKAQAPTDEERESYLPPDLYNKLMAHLLTESGRDGLFLANEVRNATGASKLRRPAQTELEGGA